MSGQKFVPGETIEPLSVKDFDVCHTYLRGIVREHYKEARASFRAYQLMPLYEKHKDALVEHMKGVYKGDASHVTHENVKRLFSNPCYQEMDTHKAMAEKLIELTEGGLPKKELNREGVDDVLKQFALEDANCPKEVVKLAHERPSVFHVLTSDYVYHNEILSKMRDTLVDKERGRGKSLADNIKDMAPIIMSFK